MLHIITPHWLRRRHWDGDHKSIETGITQYGGDLLRVPATHKDGSAVSIAFTVAMLYDDAHKVTACATVIRDETARFNDNRALRKRLAEPEARLAARPARPQ